MESEISVEDKSFIQWDKDKNLIYYPFHSYKAVSSLLKTTEAMANEQDES
jgi:hypothetical protein